MIKTLIIENEKPQSDVFCELLRKDFPELEIVAVCATVFESIEKINLYKPELLFLDINLDIPAGGLKVLEYTRSVSYEVIFTTSHDKYAINAVKFCALDFLLKPVGTEDIKEALERSKNRSDNGSGKNIDALIHNIKQTEPGLQKVAIPVMGGHDFITVSEIIYCKASNNCTDFFLTGKRRITATKTLKLVNELLKDHSFYRIHDSYLINMNHIKKYRKGGEGGMVELTEQHEADVSRRKKDDFLGMLGI